MTRSPPILVSARARIAAIPACDADLGSCLTSTNGSNGFCRGCLAGSAKAIRAARTYIAFHAAARSACLNRLRLKP